MFIDLVFIWKTEIITLRVEIAPSSVILDKSIDPYRISSHYSDKS